MLTTDQSLRNRKNLAERKPAILVLPTIDWRLMRQHTDAVAQALNELAPGS